MWAIWGSKCKFVRVYWYCYCCCCSRYHNQLHIYYRSWIGWLSCFYWWEGPIDPVTLNGLSFCVAHFHYLATQWPRSGCHISIYLDWITFRQCLVSFCHFLPRFYKKWKILTFWYENIGHFWFLDYEMVHQSKVPRWLILPSTTMITLTLEPLTLSTCWPCNFFRFIDYNASFLFVITEWHLYKFGESPAGHMWCPLSPLWREWNVFLRSHYTAPISTHNP